MVVRHTKGLLQREKMNPVTFAVKLFCAGLEFYFAQDFRCSKNLLQENIQQDFTEIITGTLFTRCAVALHNFNGIQTNAKHVIFNSIIFNLGTGEYILTDVLPQKHFKLIGGECIVIDIEMKKAQLLRVFKTKGLCMGHLGKNLVELSST